MIDSLGAYAPHERSFYYFADAESHFNLGHYKQCIPLYEKQLELCYDNEKGEKYCMTYGFEDISKIECKELSVLWNVGKIKYRIW